MSKQTGHAGHVSMLKVQNGKGRDTFLETEFFLYLKINMVHVAMG